MLMTGSGLNDSSSCTHGTDHWIRYTALNKIWHYDSESFFFFLFLYSPCYFGVLFAFAAISLFYFSSFILFLVSCCFALFSSLFGGGSVMSGEPPPDISMFSLLFLRFHSVTLMIIPSLFLSLVYLRS